MSREDLYRVAAPPKYEPTRNATHLMTLAKFFKERAGDKISTDESIHFAAQILGNFDYKYRKKRVEIVPRRPYLIGGF